MPCRDFRADLASSCSSPALAPHALPRQQVAWLHVHRAAAAVVRGPVLRTPRARRELHHHRIDDGPFIVAARQVDDVAGRAVALQLVLNVELLDAEGERLLRLGADLDAQLRLRSRRRGLRAEEEPPLVDGVDAARFRVAARQRLRLAQLGRGGDGADVEILSFAVGMANVHAHARGEALRVSYRNRWGAGVHGRAWWY